MQTVCKAKRADLIHWESATGWEKGGWVLGMPTLRQRWANKGPDRGRKQRRSMGPWKPRRRSGQPWQMLLRDQGRQGQENVYVFKQMKGRAGAENPESAVCEMASRPWDWRSLSTQRRDRYSGLASLSLIFSTTRGEIMLALRIKWANEGKIPRQTPSVL